LSSTGNVTCGYDNPSRDARPAARVLHHPVYRIACPAMREKRRLLRVLVVLGLLCAALVVYAQFFHKSPDDSAQAGNAKPLTLRAAANTAHGRQDVTLEFREDGTAAGTRPESARFVTRFFAPEAP